MGTSEKRGEAVVAVVASGVGGSARLCSVLARERARGGDEDGRRVRGSRVAAWRRLVHRGGARQAGREEVATACGFARRARALAYWREEEGDRVEKVGWAAKLRWAAQSRASRL